MHRGRRNHACAPNVRVVYAEAAGSGVVARVVALRDIAAGEELCASYLDADADAEMSAGERVEALTVRSRGDMHSGRDQCDVRISASGSLVDMHSRMRAPCDSWLSECPRALQEYGIVCPCSLCAAGRAGLDPADGIKLIVGVCGAV